MATKIAFELVTPDRLLISEEVNLVTIPGGEGDYGVMVGHQPLITTVRPGLLEIESDSSVTKRVFIDGGFAEVTADHCAVMTEEAIPLEEVQRADIESRVKDAEEAIGLAKTDTELRLLEFRRSALKELLGLVVS